ncbi:conserved hypothetical protein [Thermocrinis albus DSM 14484]|uniref:Aminoglycoside phosphotransferase n=1 Tax=Thermocrinis albus (strain DSM 14484 / JCM 11386 / HI 11/12) TaxID=638303 RepID=D3SNG4_THEAH|nr:gluconokinase [Thermocrinis albus]ADC88701.1 conserved hypothetical protein [Thermocrinis albus DSM 14484]
MELIKWLLSETGGTLIQTHASWVIVAGDVVYKIKKPVNFGFLDYSTLEKRKEFCQKEVILNRRLCPWVYLGVVPISRRGEEYLLEDESSVVEYAVKMRRIPQERLLINMLDKVEESHMKALAQHIASFHQRAERRDEWGAVSVMKFNTDENFVQTEKYIGLSISHHDYHFIKDTVDDFYQRYSSLMERRIAEGKIRDGHGDIRLEHVAFLEEGICVFDCIEFNDRFRCGDVINDMCFLSMELEFEGYHHLARVYEESYREFSQDEDMDILLPFFKSYRAYVRGKVESFLLDDPYLSQEEKEKHLLRARKFFSLSKYYAQTLRERFL